MRTAAVVVLVVSVLLGALYSWSPIRPAAFSFPSLPALPPDTLHFSPRPAVQLPGPESLAEHPRTHALYAGLADGRIVVSTEPSKPFVTVTRTGGCSPDLPELQTLPIDPDTELKCGRPLGMRFVEDSDQLLVCDASLGLLSVDVASGQITTLATNAEDGSPLLLVNDVIVEPVSGLVFFTDSSKKWRRPRILYEFLEGGKTGRLLSFDLRKPTSKPQIVLSELAFPNGIELATIDGRRSLLICSTPRSEILRFDLENNSLSVFLKDLPCFPDNIRALKGSPDRFIVGCSNKRVKPFSLPHLLAEYPSVKQLVASILPYNFILKLQPPTGIFLVVTADKQVQVFLDPETPSAVPFISEAHYWGESLYLGSFFNNFLGVANVTL